MGHQKKKGRGTMAAPGDRTLRLGVQDFFALLPTAGAEFIGL